MTSPEFLKSGLRFSCQRCGGCCTGVPGTVYVALGEVKAIAGYLQISQSQLISRYLYSFRDSYSIREDEHGACHFFQNKCLIYPVRPWQCQSYPFWFKNMRNEDIWGQVSRECPGIGVGALLSPEEILHIVQQTMHI